MRSSSPSAVTQPSSQLAYPIVQSLTSSNALTAGTLPFRAAAWPCTCPLSTVGVYPVPKTVSCQRFWPDSTWAFSGVTPSTGTTAANNLWLGAQTHIPSLNHQLTKLDDRDMTPILRKYRWHELLSGVGSTGQDIKTLTSLFLFLLRATISPDAQYPVTIQRWRFPLSQVALRLQHSRCYDPRRFRYLPYGYPASSSDMRVQHATKPLNPPRHAFVHQEIPASRL